MCFRYDNHSARMAKSADAADLKSAGPQGLWGFKSPSGHHKIKKLYANCLSKFERQNRLVAVLVAVGLYVCHRGAVLCLSGACSEMQSVTFPVIPRA
jgi:hypothetical protein